MGWTKQQLIAQAFVEIGLGSDFNVDADQLEDGLRRLDTMMATWNGKGIRLGYALPSSPDESDIDADSGLPDTANEAAYLNLAIRLAPSYGKTISPDTRTAAKQAYDVLLVDAAQPLQQQSKMLPRGAGNKPWRSGRPFTSPPADPLLAGDDPITV